MMGTGNWLLKPTFKLYDWLPVTITAGIMEIDYAGG